MSNHKKWWTPIIDFLIHAIVGTAIFLIVATPAVGLSFLTEWLETIHVSKFTVTLLTMLEESIVVIDVLAVLVYIVNQTVKAFKDDDDDHDPTH